MACIAAPRRVYDSTGASSRDDDRQEVTTDDDPDGFAAAANIVAIGAARPRTRTTLALTI